MSVLLEAPHEMRSTGGRGLSVGLATSSTDIEAAQRLRHRVFVGETGARVARRANGRDADIFDPWCEHVVVRDRDSGRIAATCRLLGADRAKRIGAFHADGHFDLTRLGRLRPGIAELGRVCIDPDRRTPVTGRLLWQGIERLVRERGFRYLIGCASMSMADRGAGAIGVYGHVAARYLAPIEHRVRPRHPLASADLEIPHGDAVAPVLPPLVRAYLWAGAWVGGEPAWDPEFNTADLIFFMPVSRLDARQARHPLRAAA